MYSRKAWGGDVEPFILTKFNKIEEEVAEDFAVDPVTMVEVILVRDAEGVAVGHAALRQLGDELEVKRVFVDPRPGDSAEP